MKLGLIGLGKMGINLAQNMIRNNNEVVGFDLNTDLVEEAATYGATKATTLKEMIDQLPSPKIVWIMVPAGKPTDATVDSLVDALGKGDIVIDGGNTFWKDSLRHNRLLGEKGIHYFDCGSSGGWRGALNGGNFMIGGDEPEVFETIRPLFEGISQKDGYLYTGKAGSGHYLKMVHNGIEYGMMEAIGEGFEVLQASDFDYDNRAVAKVWNNGSVVRSWLMELAEAAFEKDPNLDAIKGRMHSNGEGQWTVEDAMDHAVPTPVISAAVMTRFRSMQDDTFNGKVVSALRNGFGGHAMDKN
ncbi:decarboxylating 6-phosphogluconate dehydrogenase [Lactobacillus sp. LC28-10]|uniref:Decarboxylating 6-phosphogluconate dehydrogenase n=1 Tax=Secundilactobacillus angelensis TaxID=2722706 RepID=A0ABX1L1Q8_9LACO|nr:decarboxylating 6-phosphogluconate dehydrogenase [Secundilactobacillus angelensis]MCH5461524.1 decarboxylating 6-phosphogluconate dehydrogenase [Secundilactobacillus angelensis]NLR19359.1 decarboxylating 6-phosphogluconate dehydrogenase [Secundilactobacillus angelensis]